MSWTEIPAGKLVAAQQRLWVEFGDDAQRIAERLINSPEFLAKIGTFARVESLEQSSSQSRARKIMGKNMFGIDDAIKHLGVVPSKFMYADLDSVPFSEKTLFACRDTHILVAVFPMQRSKLWDDIAMRFINFDKYGIKSGAESMVNAIGISSKARWQLIRKTPAAGSSNIIHRHARLPQNEKFVEAADLIYAMIAHFLGSGERLFETRMVRTSNVDVETSMRITIGTFNQNGFIVQFAHDSEYASFLGLATQVIPER
jgi:hypothetical protein